MKRCSVISLVALLASVAAAATPAPERTLLAEPPRAISDVQLTDQSGKAVKLADFRGAPVLMFFGFTHCSTACPAALHQLRQLERQHGAELGKTRIVIVSVDGERDTPAAMKTWLAAAVRELHWTQRCAGARAEHGCPIFRRVLQVAGRERRRIFDGAQLPDLPARRQGPAARDVFQRVAGHHGKSDKGDRCRVRLKPDPQGLQPTVASMLCGSGFSLTALPIDITLSA